eukprot:Hpha_TRINITY_DN11619_c0_g1::TRINITY_DN11619_c0_g1_i1::g.48966::m.48966
MLVLTVVLGTCSASCQFPIQKLTVGPGTNSQAIDWASCAGTIDGGSCLPSCATGYTPVGGHVAISCPATGSSADLSNFSCQPHTCLSLPATAENVSLAPCLGKTTGDTCDPQCPPGFSPNPFTLTCSKAGQFESYAETCLANMCSGWGEHGWCKGMFTGQECKPECRAGFTRKGGVKLVCNSTGGFDVGGLDCTPNPCTGGPMMGTVSSLVEPGGYWECSQKQSGEVCAPICEKGYHVEGEIALTCVMDSDGLARYNATAAHCVANDCLGGALASTTEFMNTSACDRLHTGEVCGPRDVSCADGYSAKNSFTINCEGDPVFGVYDPCLGQGARSFLCVCVPSDESRDKPFYLFHGVESRVACTYTHHDGSEKNARNFILLSIVF